MNVEFLITIYIISMAVDWIYQGQWQANNKSKWGKDDNKWLSFRALISHAFTYSVITSCFTLLLINDFSHCLIVFIILFISHAIIDTRIPVVWIMKAKGLTDEQIHDYQSYGFMHIGIDHRLHELVLLMLSFIV